MTIAIGGLWPWGGAEALPQLPGPPALQLPQSAILVVDSRWSFGQGGHADVGAKLFQLNKYVGAVYAGDVDAGERCLHTIAKSFRLGKIRPPMASRVAEQLRASYNKSKSRSRLLILEKPELGRFEGEYWARLVGKRLDRLHPGAANRPNCGGTDPSRDHKCRRVPAD